MGIRPSIDGETDCHVGPMALLAMTDHGAAGIECREPVGRGILDAPPFRRTTGQVTMIVRVGRDDSARPAPAPAEADSPCQGGNVPKGQKG